MPRIIPKKDDINFESELSHLKHLTLELFNKARNLFATKTELEVRQVFKSIKSKDVIIIRADKGGTLVILTKEQYDIKINEHVNKAN